MTLCPLVLNQGTRLIRLPAELLPVQLRVQTIPCQQLVVTAGLYEAAVVQDEDLVGGEDGGEAVGDDEGRTTSWTRFNAHYTPINRINE